MSARIASVLLRSLVLFALAGASSARAQSPHALPMPTPATAAERSQGRPVPPGDAVIRGRVVRAGSSEGVGDTDVVLYARTAVGDEGVRVSRTDASGAFAFENISKEPSTAYLIGARYDGIPFGALRISFEPGEREREVTVEVTGRTPDSRAVSVRELRLRVESIGSQLAVRETYRLENRGSETIYAKPSERASAVPALRVRLPDAAAHFTHDVSVLADGLERDGADVTFWGPVFPGDHELSLDYQVPAAGSAETEIRKRVPTAVKRVVLLHPEDGPAVAASGFEPGDPVRVGEQTYRSLEGGPLDRFALLSLHVALPPAQRDPSALSISHARVFFEIDAAALRIREEIHLRVEGDQPLVATLDAPLLRIPLPQGATGLRFGNDALRMGLQAAAEGGLVFQGPIPSGASVVHLGYDLPAQSSTASWERRFGFEIPVLMLLIQDTGLIVETDRLHRRRSVRTPDLSYMVAEGFHIAADETLSLTLRPLSARLGLRPRAAGIVTWGVALLAVGLVLVPAWLGNRVEAPDVERASPALQRQREALYASIRDLDHDYEVGKVEESDYRVLRDSLRARAVATLRAEREAPRPEAETEPRADTQATNGFCTACGAPRRQADRFCSQCGQRLDTDRGGHSGGYG
jgi:hypothetical protein